MPSYSNQLRIEHKHKGIPYGGNGQLRDDGDANYGFKYAKNNEPLLRSIPELKRDADLYNLAICINSLETGLFSIGCVSGVIDDAEGHRKSGYMEFAINSCSAISDARNYFSIFFHFDSMLNKSGFGCPFAYSWELQPATFTEHPNAVGFTCSVFLNSHYSSTQNEANKIWSQGLSTLGNYLKSYPSNQQDYIYSP